MTTARCSRRWPADRGKAEAETYNGRLPNPTLGEEKTSVQAEKLYWYDIFRKACYVGIFGSLVWTVVMVAPVAPLSEIPRIIVGAPGEWLLVAYLVYISLGAGAFGWLSGLLIVIERQENRKVSSAIMWPGFVMLFFGVTLSCLLLGYAGASGGYASMSGSTYSLQQLLAPYVNPIASTAIVATAGAALVLLAMVRARGP